MPPSEQAGAVLTINLGAIVENYHRLSAELQASECAAVVKADAYGLGARRVGPALAQAGCQRFFVAHVSEGASLRQVVPDAAIYVLHGPMPGSEAEFVRHKLTPVLCTLAQLDAWAELARHVGGLDALIHVDTGMNRLGLSAAELKTIEADPQRLDGMRVSYVMSHLIAAEDPDSPLNAQQGAAFRGIATTLFAGVPASLANSSGIFLGAEYHFDLVRPGVALYGVNPLPGRTNPMTEVIRLQGKIVAVREIDRGHTVGYGATYQADGPTRIATVPVGYADGYHRSLSNAAEASVAGVRVPVVGRVSMDLITLDVSAVPPDAAMPGAVVDLIGGAVPIDDVAAAAGTIGYETLTSLGSRFHRVYLEAA